MYHSIGDLLSDSSQSDKLLGEREGFKFLIQIETGKFQTLRAQMHFGVCWGKFFLHP